MPRYALETLLLILLILWVLGAFVSPVGGHLIHLLLVAVVALAVARFVFQERGAV